MANSLNLLIATVAAAVSLSMAMDRKHVVDLCFIIDSSASVCSTDPTFNKTTDTTCSQWQNVLNFTQKIVNKLDIGPDAVQVGMVVFGTKAYRRWNMTKYLDKALLQQAIAGLDYVAGTTNTSGALYVAASLIYKEAYGDRLNAPNVAILVTDGVATDQAAVQPAVDYVHGLNITTYSIGVTDSTMDKVKLLSSNPQQIGVNYYIVPRYTDLV